MVASSDIGWASYRQYEGPFFRGHASFRMPAEPTQADRVVRVITATEGGHYDSFNGYDKLLLILRQMLSLKYCHCLTLKAVEMD